MDIEDLRTFVEVANAGGVSPAARRLGVAKSIVSRATRSERKGLTVHKGGVVIALCTAIAGCVPSSERLMEGTFTVEGVPRAGVQVWISTNLDGRDCRGDGELAAVTDAAGVFKAVAPDMAFRPCFVVDGRSYATFIVLRASPGDTPAKPMRCGLPVMHTGHFEDGQICY